MVTGNLETGNPNYCILISQREKLSSVGFKLEMSLMSLCSTTAVGPDLGQEEEGGGGGRGCKAEGIRGKGGYRFMNVGFARKMEDK